MFNYLKLLIQNEIIFFNFLLRISNKTNALLLTLLILLIVFYIKKLFQILNRINFYVFFHLYIIIQRFY